MNRDKNTLCAKQQGAILIVALLFLLLTAAISATVMNTSVIESRMANNEQFQEEAFQKVQAIANALVADDSNLVVTGNVGHKICATGVSGDGCNTSIITLPSSVTNVPSGVTLDYYAERQGPLFAPLPFRLGEDQAGSAAVYNAALFEVVASYDGTAQRLGKAEIAQGVAVRVAVSDQ